MNGWSVGSAEQRIVKRIVWRIVTRIWGIVVYVYKRNRRQSITRESGQQQRNSRRSQV